MIGDIITAATARLTGVPVLVGKRYLDANGKPPRVVFVPTRDRFGPAQRVGGAQPALATRIAGLQVHVWGADVDATEQLAHQVIAALIFGIAQDLDVTKIAPKGYRLIDGGWLEDAWTNAGEVWVGNFEFDIPVLPTALPTKVVTSIPVTAQLETPGDPPTEEDA